MIKKWYDKEKTLPKEEVLKLKKEHEAGKSLTQLSKDTGHTRQCISANFKRMDIKVVNFQNRTKFKNTVFDSIDTEEKAYWLGFIFADGYISNSPNKEGVKTNYAFEISLRASDYEHLDKFNAFMEHEEDNVVISDAKCGDSLFERCRWQVSNKHMWSVLNSYGCTPQKSLTLEFPEESIFKSTDLIVHFIRGYFDGDGGFSTAELLYKTIPRISLSSGSPKFLTSLRNYLPNHDIHKKFSIDTRSNCVSIELTLQESLDFIHFIYDDAAIYLNRKYELYKLFSGIAV